MDVTDGFVDAMVTAPLGVAMLAALEARAGEGSARRTTPTKATPASVARAVDAVEQMSFGELVTLAVATAVFDAGPWMPRGPATVAAAYRQAPARRPIAEAVAARFGTALHAPIDRTAQQWWTDVPATPWRDHVAASFRDFEHVYGAGQFTWAGLWTVTDAPVDAHQELIAAWELERGPVARWSVPITADARVFEVHRPTDWARLVGDHPRAGQPHPEWELPGINQHVTDLSAILGIPGQRAARTSIRRHLVPDWRSVARRYDGVHLSWAGFITTEGCITDLGHGDVAMLRYWFSERTHWLADVFGAPRPLEPVPGR